MKKILLALAVAMILPTTSCTRSDDEPTTAAESPRDTMQQMTIRFTFPMATSVRPMTRGTLADAQMTDLWLFDYMDGTLTNTIHQTADDATFGSISLQADYGSHQLYFVASRGTTPTVSGTTITWVKPSDTFWGSLALDVAPGMSVTQSVALARVATRLRIAVTDEVPATLSQFSITPAHWYYGLDYTTGEPVGEQQTARTVDVPSSYVGTTGQLAVSIYGLCPATDYTTDVAVSALTQDGSPLATLTLSDVPLRRNRVTSYSGQLFGHAGMLTVSLNDAWEDDLTVSW
jgi:hypothetical protein